MFLLLLSSFVLELTRSLQFYTVLYYLLRWHVLSIFALVLDIKRVIQMRITVVAMLYIMYGARVVQLYSIFLYD